MKAIVFLCIMLSSVMAAFGALFLKLGSGKFKISLSLRFIRETLRNWRLLIGVVMYGVSTVIFIYALRLDELSVVYPLTSMSYVFVTLLSILYLNEKMNAWKILGVSLIIAGVIMVRI
jgi:multidrug transporter EmrE-like cation transporter